MWTTLLLSGRCTEEQQANALAAVERSARLQAKLVEDLLDVSRIVSGKLRLELGVVEPRAVVVGALESIRMLALQKSIALEILVDPAVGTLLADPARLQQVVWNLLSNAVKFTPSGGQATVRVTCEGSSLSIRVTDTGQGIDPQFLPHIFERFRQEDASTTRSQGGLGLGLAIVRHLTELHGGSVEATSEGPGRGSTFTVRLPRRPAPLDSGEPRPISGASGNRGTSKRDHLKGVSVLVVDDDRDSREAIALLLERCGAVVRAASTVQQALTLIDQARPGVVLSDIAMPFQDGFALMREVRRRDQQTGGHQTIIALTAYASHDEEQRILEAGFDGHLAKPIEASTLVSALERVAAARA